MAMWFCTWCTQVLQYWNKESLFFVSLSLSKGHTMANIPNSKTFLVIACCFTDTVVTVVRCTDTTNETTMSEFCKSIVSGLWLRYTFFKCETELKATLIVNHNTKQIALVFLSANFQQIILYSIKCALAKRFVIFRFLIRFRKSVDHCFYIRRLLCHYSSQYMKMHNQTSGCTNGIKQLP